MSLSSLLVALNYRPRHTKPLGEKRETAVRCINTRSHVDCCISIVLTAASHCDLFANWHRTDAASSFTTDHRAACLARSHWTFICELLIGLLFLKAPSRRSIINALQPLQVYCILCSLCLCISVWADQVPPMITTRQSCRFSKHTYIFTFTSQLGQTYWEAKLKSWVKTVTWQTKLSEDVRLWTASRYLTQMCGT